MIFALKNKVLYCDIILKKIIMKNLIASFLLLSLAVTGLHAQQKRIYIALDDHTDFMWTSNTEGYRDAFLETLDYYIDLNDQTARQPYPYQNKWNCDGSYWVHIYEQNRSPEQFDRLIKQIREGRITVPFTSLSSVMGIAPMEATLRDMYYGGRLQRRYGLDLTLAINMEDQVLPLGLSSLWAGSGAKYSWRGVCACVTQVAGLDNRPHEIYWYTGLDGRRVMMKWYSVNPEVLTNNNKFRYNLGNYLEANHQLNAIIDCKELMSDTVRYPYRIAAAFGKGGDDLKTFTDQFPKVARENTDDEYQIIVSNEIDFFRDMEENYGEVLPLETLSYGSTEWGTALATMAELSASVKRAVEKLRAAEAMYTLVALDDPHFTADLDEMRKQAWFACGLYYEHDWTADSPHVTRKQRADWQRKIAAQLIGYVDTLYNRSLARMEQLVAKNKKDLETFFVFNPLGWTRTDVCDYAYEGPRDIVVVDRTTSRQAPFQFIEKDGKPYLRVLADGIPSMGYKLFGIRKGQAVTQPYAAKVNEGIIESDFYAISLTQQGVITSLIDKRNSYREYIRAIDKKFANDLGGGNQHVSTTDKAFRVENEGPVSVTLVAESYKPLKHTTKVTLFKAIDRIEIENIIAENFGNKLTSYAFSFNLDDPKIRHEEAGAILDVRQASDGGHYADSICRLDWVALNHFADIAGKEGGMMLSNRDAYFMKTGQSTIQKLDIQTPQINVLVGGKVTNWLGIESQDGDSHFENFFALRPYADVYNPAETMKFSLAHQNPLVAGKATGKKNVYGEQFSLCAVSDPNVMIWAVKPTEEGIDNGIIVRLWNMSDTDTDCTVSSDRKIGEATLTTHVETDIKPLRPIEGKLDMRMGHNRIETFRLFLK